MSYILELVILLILFSQNEAIFTENDCNDHTGPGDRCWSRSKNITSGRLVNYSCCSGKVDPKELSNFTNVDAIILKGALLSEEVWKILRSAKVTTLIISHCLEHGITTIKESESNNQILKLEITNCRIKDISPGAFDSFTRLKTLNLEHNDIGELKAGQFNNIRNLRKLVLIHNRFTTIPSDLFNKVNRINHLDLTTSDGSRDTTIWKNTFANLTSLEILYLEGHKITQIPAGTFDCLTRLRELNLRSTELTHFPIFEVKNNKMQKLYVDHNNIKELKSHYLTNIPALKRIELKNNDYKVIPNIFFKKSNTITELSFADTPIREIKDEAFVNLDYLTKLTLDGTDIDTFPTKGLTKLEELSVRNIERLFSIPRDLPEVQTIKVSDDRSFLCCKFYLESYLEKGGPVTKFKINTTTAPTNYASSPTMGTNVTAGNASATTAIPTGFVTTAGIQIITVGTFNPNITFVPRERHAVACIPGPNEFQPCENIMGANWLTVVSFIVAPFALCGNFIVIVVLIFARREYNVARFLITNLAIADLCLGIYLMSLVVESVITSGEYYNYVKVFQYGASCNALGFLAMFSSVLSVFSLTIITVERYLTIVYALYPKRRLRMKHAVMLMTFGWLMAVTIAVLPIVGISSYSKVAICLPFEVENGGEYYLVFVFCLNGLSFIFIAALYMRIYRTVFLQSNSTPTRGHDSRVARRMAVLVLTDFACFAPIAVMALSAMSGNTLINVAESKYLLVFFFPLNSLMNPLLYAIITKNFRRDLADILKHCFVCDKNLSSVLRTSLPNGLTQSNNDILSRTRQSFDFNASMDTNGSTNNGHSQSVNSLAISFSKAEPSLVKFQSIEKQVNGCS